MKIFHIFIMSIAASSCYTLPRNSEKHGSNSLNKTSREIEAYTTILLDDEPYSIISIAKHPKNFSKPTSRKGAHSSKLKGSNKNYHRLLKENEIIEQNPPKPKSKTSSSNKNSHPSGKLDLKHPSHKLDKVHRTKKKVHKRHFDRSYPIPQPQEKSINPLAPNTSFVLTPIPNSFQVYSSGSIETNNVLNVPRPLNNKVYPSVSYNLRQNLSENPWIKSFHPPTNIPRLPKSPEQLESSNSKRDNFPNSSANQRYGIELGENSVIRFNRKSARYSDQFPPTQPTVMPTTVTTVLTTVTTVPTTVTTVPTTVTTVPTTHSLLFHQADIIERNLKVNGQLPKIEKDEKEEALTNGNESEDAIIHFDESCEQVINETCWMQREVGDVLTLAIKIDSQKKQNSFQIKWMKVYHIYESKKGKPLEIEPGKLPWNMVSGSEGRELRLNPVTNTDLDPNCIVAKVFLVTKHREKTLYKELRKLTFRIDIPIIDMGKVYAGEELSINIENFISLPERGNLLFDWNLETKPHQYLSLPSNIKVSHSGRSVLLKELKKGRMGVLNCVVYSPNKFAVAKRRFNILKIAESVRRRSTVMNLNTVTSDLKRNRRCRHIIRRSQERAMQWLKEGSKPKSRQKRFRRMNVGSDRLSELDCEPLKKEMYSRWVRSLFADFSTENPKLMSLEKLFELSEEGDGTLDDVIPHEVHYVRPLVKVLSGTSNERSVGHLSHSSNCTSNEDCGTNAVCVMRQRNVNSTVTSNGFCNCRPEFYGDGHTCQKIPLSNHREKRLRRDASRDFAVPKHLFYEHAKEIPSVSTTEIAEDEELETELTPKILAFEEEESFLLSNCIDDKDCSVHASCIQPTNGHPYCKCRPGFRGNGIFCWEIIDYVPPEEHFLAEEEIEPTVLVPEDHLASKISASDELEDE